MRISMLPVSLLLLTACAPMVTSTPIGATYPAKPDDAQVLLFSVRTPECSYEEIALVTAYTHPEPPATLEALKHKVRRLGADAVVGLTEFSRQDPEGRGGLRGTAVRFVDPACRR
jgi:hypothetical protein